MLKPVTIEPSQNVEGEFVLIAARYNQRYVDGLVRAAKKVFQQAKVNSLQIVRVPGSFEIPAIASHYASHSPPWAAITCLGVLFQGETVHANQVAEAVTHSLAQLQVQCRVPVIHGVGLFETTQQARPRCLEWEHNRGREAALTALEMARLMTRLRGTGA